MEEETNDPLGILTKSSPESYPLGILGDSKKKVPTKSDSSVGGENSSVGLEKTQPTNGSESSQPTYSVKVDEGPLRSTPNKVTVGGKEFEVEKQPEMISSEVKSAANKLFKNASPITDKAPVTVPKDHPAMKGIIKETGEPALKNLSTKAVAGNEDILTEYISTLTDDEKNRLRGSKLNDEQSLEILNKAYSPKLDQAIVDLSVLRERGVEDDLKQLDDKQKEIQSLTQTVNADKTALVNLQSTFLKQKGYDKISAEYKDINRQLQSKQAEVSPLLEKKQELESDIDAFSGLINDGQFTGNKQEYDAYQALFNQYQELTKNPKLTELTNLVNKQNEIAKSINSMVTPEYKEQEDKLVGRLNSNIAAVKATAESVGEFMTPEKAQNIELYQNAVGEYNAITNKLVSAKSKMPEVIAKEKYVDAMNVALEVNPILKSYDLASRAFGSFTSALGSTLSSIPQAIGGVNNEYDIFDKTAESITDFFAPKAITTTTTTAGQQSKYKKDFYESETDAINWEALPGEIADQVGSFVLLAGAGTIGGLAKMSDFASIVVPGAMMSYNDAYKTGREIYGNDAVGASLYAQASSWITGITELIMPDRDILTGGAVDNVAKSFVTNYIKKGKRYAAEQASLSLIEMMGKEVGEEFADRWKDVVLKGAVNLTGGDIENKIPTLNEHLSIAASTAALTGLGGGVGQLNKNSNARKLAVYEAAKSYPQTMEMLNAMQAEGHDVDRIEEIKSEVSNMFISLKEVPADLSTPKRIAVAEKLNTIKAIEDAMASGISPIIVDQMKDNIKVISGEIQKIIADPEFDKKFGADVNKEVKQLNPTQNAETIRSNEGQVQEGGLVGQSSQREGGENIQQQAPQESGNEKVQVTKETLPSVTKDELVGMIADGTAEELIKSEQVDPLTFMEAVEKNQLPLPKFFLNMDEAGTAMEQGYYTEEEDARLLELINKAQERSGINNLNLVDENTLPPTAEGTQEAITPQSNEQEVNQKGQGREELLSPSEAAKTEPVSEVEAQKKGILEGNRLENKKPTTEARIESANKRIDSAAQALKDILKVNVVPNVKKSGFDTEAIIDLIAQATKQLVNKGIKTQVALEQAITTLRDAGVISGKEITKMRNVALSMVDEEYEKVWVTKNGKYDLLKNTFGDFEVRDEKGKPVTKRSIRKNVITEYTKGKNLYKGKTANLEGVKEQDAARYIADNSENPMQVAQAMAYTANQMDESSLDYKEQIIAEHLPHIKRSSFVNENYESNLIDEKGKFHEGTSIQVNYLRANGLPLDKAAEAINSGAKQEQGFVTEQDIINFILKFPQGKSQFFNQTNPDYLALQNRFYELTGFNATPEILEQAKDYAETEEDMIGLEPVESDEGGGVVPNTSRKKRRFTGRVTTSGDVGGEFKSLIRSDQKYYNNMPNVITLAEANYLIDTVGEDEAVAKIMDMDNDLPDAVRATVGQILLKRFEAKRDYDKAINMLEYLTKKATETGRFLQAFAMWSRLTPEGQLRVVQRTINKEVDKRTKEDSIKTKTAKKIIKDAKKDAIDEALKNTGLGKKADNGKTYATQKTSFASKNKIFTKEKVNQALKNIRKNGLFSTPFSEDAITVVGAIIEDGTIRFADFSKEVIRVFGSKATPYLRDLYEAGKKKLIDSGVLKEDVFSTEKEIDAHLAELDAIKNAELEKRIADKFEKATKLKSDKLFKEALGMLMLHPDRETLWNRYKNSAVDRLKNMPVSELLDEAEENPALQEFVDGLVKNMRQKIAESMPEKEKGEARTEKSAIAIIADAFKNLEKYKEVWEQTRKEMAKKYADNPDALDAMDRYFGNILDKPFSKKLVESTVTELVGRNLDKLIELYYKGFDTSSFESEVIEKIIFETGLSEEVIKSYIDDVKKEIGDRKNKSIEKIEDKKQKALEKLKTKLENISKTTNKPLWDDRRDKSIKSLISTLENSLIEKSKKDKTSIEEFAQRLTKNISKELRDQIKTKSNINTDNPITFLVEVLKNYEKYQDVINETQNQIIEKYSDNPTVLMQFDDALFKIASSPFYKKLVEKSVKQGIKSLDINVNKIARAHYTEYDSSRRSLVDKLITDADLPSDEAAKLAKAIGDEFDRIMMEKKKSIMDNLVKEKVVKKKKVAELASKLSDMINLGAFSDREFMDSWAKANDYPKLTEENLKEIKRLAAEVQKYPDGAEKFRAMEDLLAYQEQIKGIPMKELMIAVWYAHVLSGHNTQLVNAYSNILNSITEFIIQARKNPAQADMMVLGWLRGIKQGFLEGKEVLKTGYNPVRGKLEMPSTLEVKSKLAKDKIHYAHAVKYVRRAMVAVDVLFFEGLKEMKSYQLAVSMAKSEADKLDPSYEVMAAAMAKLNATDSQLKNYRDLAEIEYDQKMKELSNSGLKGKEYDRIAKMYKRDMARRVYELMKQGRNAELIEQANDFARRGTYNQVPEGTLGAMAKTVNQLTSYVPVLRLVVPFTNIIANVANEAINYTPLGALRAIRSGGGIITGRDHLTKEQKVDLRADVMAKAIVGTASMAAILALSYDWDEDDDTPALIEITGNGTGNFGMNYNLSGGDEQWQAYSFRVWNKKEKKYSHWYKYQYTPLVVAFSMIGAIKDIEKYAPDKVANTPELILASAVIGMRTFLDMTFLSTIDSFMNILFNDFDHFTANRFIESILNIGNPIPNMYTQIAKEIEAINKIPMKNTKLVGSDPKTYIAKYIQHLPVARDVLNDKVNVLGDPIIPITNKFVSGEWFFDREVDPMAKLIVDKGLLNLKVQDQKRLKAYDPQTMEDTPLTEDEYFYYNVVRGKYIKEQLQNTDPDLLDKKWAIQTAKEASAEARDAVEIKRLLGETFEKGVFK